MKHLFTDVTPIHIWARSWQYYQDTLSLRISATHTFFHSHFNWPSAENWRVPSKTPIFRSIGKIERQIVVQVNELEILIKWSIVQIKKTSWLRWKIKPLMRVKWDSYYPKQEVWWFLFTDLFPSLERVFVIVPVNLQADRVAFHTVVWGVIYWHAVEILSPNKLACDRGRNGAVRMHLSWRWKATNVYRSG